MCILANAINTCVLDPPDAVLDQIASQMGIPLVQIGHASGEPSIHQNIFLRLWRMYIHQRPFKVRSLHKIVLMIQPIFRRKVFQPPVTTTAMVEDHIHHHLYTPVVRLIDQLAILLVRAKTRIYLIEISDRIAMVGASRHTVFQNGIQPNRGKSQILDIIQFIDDTPDIASVTSPRTRTIHLHAIQIVILRIGIRKTVRCDQVHHIRR